MRQLFNDLVRLEIEMWTAVEARLKRELNLPLTHFEPMSVMERITHCRVYDIATELAMTPGGVSKLVDRIEAGGYCRRRPNPEDRRSSVIELTPEGRRLVAEAGAVVDDELEQWLGRAVPERTLRQFAATLRRLRAAGRRAEVGSTRRARRPARRAAGPRPSGRPVPGAGDWSNHGPLDRHRLRSALNHVQMQAGRTRGTQRRPGEEPAKVREGHPPPRSDDGVEVPGAER